MLYEGEEPQPVSAVLKKYGYKCPNCNKKLVFNPSEITVFPRKQRG